jgi:hypothetical protein
MNKPVPAKLRVFYTDIERHCSKPFTKLHKERVTDLANNGDRKFPYRKIDTILIHADADYVFNFAKEYRFKKK